jgi:predicted TIM-barrel fold metal-dependent hydrolase
MFKREEQYAAWDRNPRLPSPPPPPKSCDCQFHIYEDPDKFPPRPNASYQPIDATFADAERMMHAIGFTRGVIVYPTTYGTDNRLLLDVLENLSPEQKKNYRATCILDDSVTDAELDRLDAAGVVGARFNFMKQFHLPQPKAQTERSFARLKELGWHARVHVRGNDVLEFAEVLEAENDIPMVIDHLGHPGFEGGLDRPNVRWILDILKRDNWWMMVSNGTRGSKMERGYDDAVPYGRAYVETAPDRIIFGTDWPHVNWTKRMMNEAESVELFYRYVDNDPAMIRKVLVDNPARLHGFSD